MNVLKFKMLFLPIVISPFKKDYLVWSGSYNYSYKSLTYPLYLNKINI